MTCILIKNMDIKRKNTSLQGLRGLAILCIMVSHCCFITDDSGKNMLSWLGALGVEFFVILSGVLTVYWRLEYGKEEFISSFYYAINKIKKYYWLHLITLLMAIPLAYTALFVDWNGHTWGKLALNLLLLQSWIPVGSYYFSFNPVSWYLSVTAFFLVMTPRFVRKIRLMKRNKIIYMLLTIVLLQWLFVILSNTVFLDVKNEKIHWFIYVCPFIRYMDFVLGGGTYALARDVYREDNMFLQKLKAIFILSSLIIIVISILSAGSNNEMFSVATWSVPCALVTCSLMVIDDKYCTCFRNRFLVYLGNISFELFLLHWLIIWYLGNAWNKLYGVDINIAGYVIALILSILLATIIHICTKKLAR